MQNALSQQAAPMRIAFGQIPNTEAEEDSSNELWLKRERQFKVLAETAHREAREKGRGLRSRA